MKRSVLLLVLSVSLAFQGCGSETTLNRVGAVVLVAVSAYQLELDQLLAQGQISQEKRDKLFAQSVLIKSKAEEFSKLINGFAVIKAGDIPQIILQINGLVGLLDRSLGELAGIAPTNGAIRALRYAVATLNVAAVVVAALFPPAQQIQPSSVQISEKGIAPGKIKVPLPPRI